jgi:transcriptional regulator with XRE-family HTH domain
VESRSIIRIAILSKESQSMNKQIQEVCEKIRLLRNQKGLTILELAERAGIAHSAVYYIESKKKEPTLSTLFKLAEALEISITEFFR